MTTPNEIREKLDHWSSKGMPLDLRNDITYLLSLLDEAKEALEKIKIYKVEDITLSGFISVTKSIIQMKKIAQVALTRIKGEK